MSLSFLRKYSVNDLRFPLNWHVKYFVNDKQIFPGGASPLHATVGNLAMFIIQWGCKICRNVRFLDRNLISLHIVGFKSVLKRLYNYFEYIENNERTYE